MIANLSTLLAFSQPDVSTAIGTVGGTLSSTIDGGTDAGTIFSGIMKSLLPMVNGIAVVVIVIAGLLLIISQDENQIQTARRTVIAAIASLILINIAAQLRNIFAPGAIPIVSGAQGTALGFELQGIINFIEVPVAVIAVLMIIISGVRAILTVGTDQGITNLRRTVFSVVAGIILIGAKIILTESIVGDQTGTSVFVGPITTAIGLTDAPDPVGIIATIVDAATIVVGFMALAAVVVIVIAGIFMVLNKGDQEVATRTRNLIIRVVVGLVIIAISLGLVKVVTG